MPPKTTSTRSCSTSFVALAAATASSVAPSSSSSSRCRPSRPPLALMSPMTIRATLALASPTNESGPVWSAMTPTLMGGPSGLVLSAPCSPPYSALGRSLGATVQRVGVRGCSRRFAPHTSGALPILDAPLRLAEFVATLALAQDNAFGQPLESQLRSCLLASWICEAAGFDERGARERLLGGAAALRRLHRSCARGRDAVRRRDRDPRPDARPRRRQSDRGHGRRRRLRDGRALRGRARRDHPHAPGDGPRVGGAQLLLRMRGRRHARRAARLRPRRARGARVHVRALERQGLPGPRGGRGDPARRCASCTSATTWRRSGGSSRPSARSRPPASAATARTIRRSPTCSSSTDAAGSIGSRKTEPWDAVLALEPEPRRMLEGDALDRRPDGRRRLHRPQVAVHGRPQPPLRASSPPTPPGCSGSPEEAITGCAGRRSCTTSARPRSRTRSGTSPARSRGRSSTASSSTRC